MQLPKKVTVRKIVKWLVWGFVLIELLILCSHIFTSCSNDIRYFDYNAEELATALLEDNHKDVEAAIADLQQMQQEGVLKAYICQDPDSPVEISLTYQSQYDTNTVEDALYQRLMRRFISIILYEDGTIAFHSRGFLIGYSGFYYSTTGEKDIGGGADWYETHPLEENFYFFNFGY